MEGTIRPCPAFWAGKASVELSTSLFGRLCDHNVMLFLFQGCSHSTVLEVRLLLGIGVDVVGKQTPHAPQMSLDELEAASVFDGSTPAFISSSLLGVVAKQPCVVASRPHQELNLLAASSCTVLPSPKPACDIASANQVRLTVPIDSAQWAAAIGSSHAPEHSHAPSSARCLRQSVGHVNVDRLSSAIFARLPPDLLCCILSFVDLRLVLTVINRLNRACYALTRGHGSTWWPHRIKFQDLNDVVADPHLSFLAPMWPVLRELDLSRCTLITDHSIGLLVVYVYC